MNDYYEKIIDFIVENGQLDAEFEYYHGISKWDVFNNGVHAVYCEDSPYSTTRLKYKDDSVFITNSVDKLKVNDVRSFYNFGDLLMGINRE